MYTSTQKLNTPWVSNVLSLMKHAWMFIFPRLDQFSSFVGNKTMTASFVYRGENISRIIELIENIGLIYRCSRYFVQWQIVETMSILRARELSLPRIKLEYFFNFQAFYECRRNWTKTTFRRFAIDRWKERYPTKSGTSGANCYRLLGYIFKFDRRNFRLTSFLRFLVVGQLLDYSFSYLLLFTEEHTFIGHEINYQWYIIEITDRSICKADRAIPLFDLCFVRRVSMLGRTMISRWKMLQADTKIINDVESLDDRDLSSNLEQRDSMRFYCKSWPVIGRM